MNTNDIFLMQTKNQAEEEERWTNNFRLGIKLQALKSLAVVYHISFANPHKKVHKHTSARFLAFIKIVVYTMCLMHLLKFQVKFNLVNKQTWRVQYDFVRVDVNWFHEEEEKLCVELKPQILGNIYSCSR